MDMQYIIMNNKEAKRYDVIKRVIKQEINNSQATEILNLTTRHVRRLKNIVKRDGMRGLVHKSRGKPGNRKIPDQERVRIKELLHKHYHDFGPTFAAEKLREDHKINRDPKTIRAIMIEEELWKPRKRKKSDYRSWRQRRASYGELEQYDGSYEEWFEDRGEKCCLLASIDDATNRITHLKFDEHEGVEPTFKFWQEYIEKHGKPMAIYVDKFSTYSMNHKLAKENQDTLTQFERAMKELKIEVITAHSAQAKGRVENLFRTLQDRLIKEMRLKNISGIEQANKYLQKEFIPKFNNQFSVEARTKADLHKKLTKREQNKLPAIFSRHYERTVRNDFTFSYKNTWYQLEKEQPVTVFKKDIVIVEERFDGTIKIRLKGKYLNYKKLPVRPKKVSGKVTPWVLTKSITWVPAKDHPWRNYQHVSH